MLGVCSDDCLSSLNDQWIHPIHPTHSLPLAAATDGHLSSSDRALRHVCRLGLAHAELDFSCHAGPQLVQHSMLYSSASSSGSKDTAAAPWSNLARTAVGQRGEGPSEDHNLHRNHRTDHLKQNHARTQKKKNEWKCIYGALKKKKKKQEQEKEEARRRRKKKRQEQEKEEEARRRKKKRQEQEKEEEARRRRKKKKERQEKEEEEARRRRKKKKKEKQEQEKEEEEEEQEEEEEEENSHKCRLTIRRWRWQHQRPCRWWWGWARGERLPCCPACCGRWRRLRRCGGFRTSWRSSASPPPTASSWRGTPCPPPAARCGNKGVGGGVGGARFEYIYTWIREGGMKNTHTHARTHARTHAHTHIHTHARTQTHTSIPEVGVNIYLYTRPGHELVGTGGGGGGL